MEKICRTRIVDVLKMDSFGTIVNVKGWVRTRRGSKQVNFIALNDGSTINNIQIVIDIEKFGEEYLKPITTGACLLNDFKPFEKISVFQLLWNKNDPFDFILFSLIQ